MNDRLCWTRYSNCGSGYLDLRGRRCLGSRGTGATEVNLSRLFRNHTTAVGSVSSLSKIVTASWALVNGFLCTSKKVDRGTSLSTCEHLPRVFGHTTCLRGPISKSGPRLAKQATDRIESLELVAGFKRGRDEFRKCADLDTDLRMNFSNCITAN
jgi:hypothetical protein